jgi:hypothetical protein
VSNYTMHGIAKYRVASLQGAGNISGRVPVGCG